MKTMVALRAQAQDKNSRDLFFMNIAIAQAQAAQAAGDFPIGAIVVRDEKIIGFGQCRNNSVGDVTEHAEIVALRDACFKLTDNNLSGATLYTTNEPCLMCSAASFQAKISRVVYALAREDLSNLMRARRLRIKDLAQDAGYPIEIIAGVGRTAALALWSAQSKNSP